MRKQPNVKVNRFRLREGRMGSSDDIGNNGVFFIPGPRKDGTVLQVIASDGGGWDHVSVSLPTRCPIWDEMVHIRTLFFADDEWAMQLSPPKDKNISYHDFCLHWWRPQTAEERGLLDDQEPEFPTPGPIPLPPSIFVAPSSGLTDRQ